MNNKARLLAVILSISIGIGTPTTAALTAENESPSSFEINAYSSTSLSATTLRQEMV